MQMGGNRRETLPTSKVTTRPSLGFVTFCVIFPPQQLLLAANPDAKRHGDSTMALSQTRSLTHLLFCYKLYVTKASAGDDKEEAIILKPSKLCPNPHDKKEEKIISPDSPSFMKLKNSRRKLLELVEKNT